MDDARRFAETALREFGATDGFEIDLRHFGDPAALVAAFQDMGCTLEDRGRYYMVYTPNGKGRLKKAKPNN